MAPWPRRTPPPSRGCTCRFPAKDHDDHGDGDGRHDDGDDGDGRGDGRHHDGDDDDGRDDGRHHDDGDDGDEGADFDANINLPLSAVAPLLSLVPHGALSDRLLDPAGDEVNVGAMRDLRRAIAGVGEAEFVAVDGEDETVRIARTGDRINVQVQECDEDGGETVDIRIPVAVVNALLSGDGETLNVHAAVEQLGELRGDIVRVNGGRASGARLDRRRRAARELNRLGGGAPRAAPLPRSGPVPSGLFIRRHQAEGEADAGADPPAANRFGERPDEQAAQLWSHQLVIARRSKAAKSWRCRTLRSCEEAATGSP